MESVHLQQAARDAEYRIWLSTRDTLYDQVQSPLFSLPDELRMLIYDNLLLAGEGDVDVLRICCEDTQDSPSIMSILRTCRRALDEAEAIFYEINRLRMCARDFANLTIVNSSRRLQAIRALTFELWGEDHLSSFMRDFAALPNLQTLHLRGMDNVFFCEYELNARS